MTTTTSSKRLRLVEPWNDDQNGPGICHTTVIEYLSRIETKDWKCWVDDASDETLIQMKETIHNFSTIIEKACHDRYQKTVVINDGKVTEEKHGLVHEMPSDRNSDISRTGTVLTSQILNQLALSRFLSPRELGRLLLLTTKEILNDPDLELAWWQLCKLRWKFTAELPAASMESFRQLYMQLEHKHVVFMPLQDSAFRSLNPALSSEKLSPDNHLLLISIRDAKTDKELLSTIRTGRQLKEFLITGRHTLRPNDHMKESRFLFRTLMPTWSRPSSQFLKSKIYLLGLDRPNDQNICCLQDGSTGYMAPVSDHRGLFHFLKVWNRPGMGLCQQGVSIVLGWIWERCEENDGLEWCAVDSVRLFSHSVVLHDLDVLKGWEK